MATEIAMMAAAMVRETGVYFPVKIFILTYPSVTVVIVVVATDTVTPMVSVNNKEGEIFFLGALACFSLLYARTPSVSYPYRTVRLIRERDSITIYK